MYPTAYLSMKIEFILSASNSAKDKLIIIDEKHYRHLHFHKHIHVDLDWNLRLVVTHGVTQVVAVSLGVIQLFHVI